MELKEKLVASFLAFENKVGVDTDSNVHDIRSHAFDHFEEHGFPTKKDEEWKYTPLKSILTNLQMLQFITWIVMASCIFFYQDCESATPASKASLVAIQLYAVCLIYLFKKKYAKKKNNQKKEQPKNDNIQKKVPSRRHIMDRRNRLKPHQ